MCLILFPDCSQYLIKFRVVCLFIMYNNAWMDNAVINEKGFSG